MNYLPTPEQLSLIYNYTNDPIFLIGVEGPDQYRVLSVNACYLRETGIQANDIINKLADELYEGEFLAQVNARYCETINAGVPKRFETNTLEGGREGFIQTTLIPVLDENGHCTNLLGVVRNITRITLEKRKLERAKQTAENYLDIAEAIIVALDADGNISMLNRKGYELLGHQAGSLIGTNWCNQFIPPEKQADFLAGYRKALRDNTIENNVNYLQQADGSRRLISWASSILRDDSGRPSGILSSGEDITDRHRAEMANITSQRMLAAEEVVSGVAHDFNNSLQGILGNIELALADHVISPEAQQLLMTASRLAEDASSRIHSLQSVSYTNDKDQFEQVNLNRIVEDVVQEAQHLLRGEIDGNTALIELRLVLSATTPYCNGIPGDLRSLLYNVVKNALEAIECSGTVTLCTRCDEHSAFITVVDSGIGMTTEVATRLFQPFFSTKGFEPGRGIGMNAAHHIAQAHAGELSILESAIGRGTTIELRLPRVVPVAYDSIDSSTDLAGSLHILWVDDDADVRALASNYLRVMGYTGDVVESGQVALAKIQSRPYSMVIADLGMPEMDGVQLADRIRQLGFDIPILALTGWSDRVRGKDKSPNINHFLAKPIRMADLKHLLSGIAAGQ